jgi:hypothetical protein
MTTSTRGYVPSRFRPRDFDLLDTFAADNEWADEMATQFAAEHTNPMTYWATYFTALRHFRTI